MVIVEKDLVKTTEEFVNKTLNDIQKLQGQIAELHSSSFASKDDQYLAIAQTKIERVSKKIEDAITIMKE